MRADPTHWTTECWMVDYTWFDVGCLNTDFYLFLGGQKRPFFGGPKTPIMARGHMGKAADFNQIVLYLETPKRDNLTPSSALRGKTHPIKQSGPWDLLRRCKTHDASPRPQK